MKSRRLMSRFQNAGVKDRAKILLGGLLFPAQTRQWLDFVAKDDILRDRFHRFPRALCKIYQPYLSTQMNCAQRVTVLTQHYRFLCQRGLADLVGAATSHPVVLSEWTCKSSQIAQLQLTAIHEGHREGDLCLRLIYKSQLIYSASLVFLEADGATQLMVGRLQGMASAGSLEVIREATRDFHNCRPVNLLLAAVRNIGHLLGCPKVLLVSNTHRISINLWRRLKITSNYDQLWAEISATRRADGDFQIGVLVDPGIDLASAPSKKRSELRKKQALMQTVFDGLKLQFTAVDRLQRC